MVSANFRPLKVIRGETSGDSFDQKKNTDDPGRNGRGNVKTPEFGQIRIKRTLSSYCKGGGGGMLGNPGRA